MNTTKAYSLQFQDHDITPEGIKDFFWPYDLPALQDSFYAWTDDFMELVQSYAGETEGPDALTPGECLLLNFIRWQQNYVLALQAMAIRQGLDKKGYTPLTPEDMPFYSAYFNDQPLPDVAYTKQILHVKSAPSFWMSALRMLKDKLNGKGIIRLPSFLYKPQSDLAVTSVFEVLDQFCAKQDHRCVFVQAEQWLRSIEDTELVPSAKDQEVIQKLMALTHKRFSQCVAPDSVMMAWFEDQIRKTYVAVKIHAGHVAQNKHKNPLPQKIVCSLDGSLNRLFRYLVHKHGGETILFDHGCSSMFKGKPDSYVTNMLGTSVFYTYSDAAAELCRETIPDVLKPKLKGCKVQGANVYVPPHGPEGPKPDKAQKTIIMMPFNLFGDEVNAIFQLSDIQAMDFNHRLVTALKGLGYNVICKPHPKYQLYQSADEGAARLGCRYETRGFETVLPEADIVFACDPTSTCMVSSILSGKPLLTIDCIGFLNERIKDKMHDRIEIVPIHFTAQNKLEIAWESLQDNIERAEAKASSRALHPLYIQTDERLWPLEEQPEQMKKRQA